MEELAEPPFHPGPMSKELAQQRAEQCTALLVRSLMCTEEFYEVVASSSRRKKNSQVAARWKYTLGAVCAAALVVLTLQYLAASDLGNHGTAAAMTSTCSHDEAPRVVAHLVSNATSSNPPFSEAPLQREEAGVGMDLPPINSSSIEFHAPGTSNPCTPLPAMQADPFDAVSTVVPTDAAPSQFTPVSACALGLIFMCNIHQTALKPPAQVQLACTSEHVAAVTGSEEPMQQFSQPSSTVETTAGSMFLSATAIVSQAMAILLTVTLLAHFTTKYLVFNFLTVASALHGGLEHSGLQPDTASSLVPSVMLTGRQDEDAVGLPNSLTVSAHTVAFQDNTVSQDVLQSETCLHDYDDAHMKMDQPVPPLQYTPLLSTVPSQVKVKGIDTTFGRSGISTPMAMDMLTPTEPPSPFPGFPALSSFVCGVLTDDATCNQTSTGISQTQPSGADSEAGGTLSPGATWSSSAPSLEACDTANGHAVAHSSCESWHFVHPLGAVTPKSPSSSTNSGAQQQGSEPASAIFDLSRFDEEGEEVLSMTSPMKKSVAFSPAASAAAFSDILRVEKSGENDASVVGPPPRQPARQLVAHKLEAQPSALASDVARTPTWPPQPTEDLGLLDDVDEELITYEALSLSKTLASGDSAPGSLQFALSEPAHSPLVTVPDRGGHEPGRGYAAVAVATSVLLTGFRTSAKSALLAACSGDEAALRAAQSELYAATSQLLGMDLAPHSHSAAGTCKALAYSTAVTPTWGVPSSSGSTGSASWASIGSRVLYGGPDKPRPPEDDASSECTIAIDGASLPSAQEIWAGGPAPLPQDIDQYLAQHSSSSTSSAHVLAALRDSLAYTGLLMTAATSQILASQAELLEAMATARREERSHICDASASCSVSALEPLDAAADADSANLEVTAVVQDLVSSVVKSIGPQGADIETSAGRPLISVGTPVNAWASNVTIAARTDFYNDSPPASVRSGSGSCAGVDRTTTMTPVGSYASAGGMSSRINPHGRSLPLAPSFGKRLETLFGALEFNSTEWSPAHDGVAPSAHNDDDESTKTITSSSVRPLWRPQVSPP